MITLEDVLQLPELKNVRVRAGEAGLGRGVRWVHVMDHTNIAEFLEGNELLLTNGHTWPKEREAEDQLLQALHRKRIAGLLFSLGPYIGGIPPAVLEFGERYNTPVLECTWSLKFVQVTQSVHAAILRRQYQTLEQADRIHRELTRKAAEANSLAEVCQALAGLLHRSVVVTDPAGRVVTGAQAEAEGQVITLSSAQHIISTVLSQAWYPLALTGAESGAARAVIAPGARPPYRLVCPVVVDRERVATLWLLDSSRKMEPIDVRAAEHAATVLALMISREREAEAVRGRLRAGLVEVLIQGQAADTPVVEEKARTLGLLSGAPCLAGIVLARPRGGDDRQVGWDGSPWRVACQQWIDASPYVSGFCEVYGERLVILLSVTDAARENPGLFRELYTRLVNVAWGPVPVVVMGGIRPDLWRIGESYREAMALAPVVLRRSADGGAYSADEWQRELQLYSAISPERARELRLRILGEELLSGHGRVLYETLRCLAAQGFNHERTADALHIHRNTLRYRLKRIEDLLQADLSIPRCQFWVQVAMDLESLALHGDEEATHP